jgi:hypothetical protein
MFNRARRESFRTVAVVRTSLLVHSFTYALKLVVPFSIPSACNDERP